MIQIDICVGEDKSTTEKGRVLEHLVAKLLEIQQYDVVETIRVTGMEIDVLAKHRINNSSLLVECKAWESPLPADVISKLMGNVYLRNVDQGWLVTTGPLSKDARGIKVEWENRWDSERKKFSFYTCDRIIEQLIAARIIVPFQDVTTIIKNDVMAEDIVLMLTEKEFFWIIPIIDAIYNTINKVYVFNARNGEQCVDKSQINLLKHKSNYYSDAIWTDDMSHNMVVDNSKMEVEVNSIVPVIGGDDWEDYRPARPEDFVGRKKLIQGIFRYFDAVLDGKTNTRLFSITAPSGMGKSSLILKIASMSHSRRRQKKYFIYALDSRTAISSRYVELSVKSCFEQADKEGFTDVETRNLEVSSISQMLQCDSVNRTLDYLNKQGKVIVLVFDQFEELFSKKELYPIFEKVKQLSNIVDQLNSNIIVGFSWKTDLTIPADHPAYYMWSNLSDRRREFDLPQFKAAEIKGAIRVFGSHLGEDINPVLRNYLSKQCQGYPWLLKKLCIHVFKLINEGNDQDTVIGQKLNIVDLFERDINELTPEEHKCVLEIAKDSPADYFKIADLFGSEVTQVLINKRIVIRRASRLTLYWDIFKDYVIEGKVPNILLDYIPQQQYATFAQITKCLLETGNMTTDVLASKVDMKISTIDNYLVDSIMFGLVKKVNGKVSLTTTSEREIILSLRMFFYKHLIYIELKNNYLQDFNYSDYFKRFESVYEDSVLAEKTQKIYAAKLLNWLVNLGMVETRSDSSFAIANAPREVNLSSRSQSRRSRDSMNGVSIHNLFWGETSPEVLEQTYISIQNKELTFQDLKKMGYRNSVSVLWSFGGLEKKNGIYYVSDTLENVYKNIQSTENIQLAMKIVSENPKITEKEMGEILEKKYNKRWQESSRVRYGSAVRRWARYFLNVDSKQKE